jgi:hypothetical protein
MSVIKRLVRRALGDRSIVTIDESARVLGREDELRHWREFCRSERFIENFCIREPNPEIDSDVELFIKGYAANANAYGIVPKVLDIGSGPVSMLSRSFSGESVDLHAADPLADDYLQLWDPDRFKGLVLPVACSIETLTENFGREEFEITHIRNALDHSANPFMGLDEMLNVTKPGGFVIVHGFANEARSEQWQGFHQWDLCWAPNNDFTIRGKDGVKHSLAKYFGTRARIMRPWMRYPANEKAWCGFVAQKSK